MGAGYRDKGVWIWSFIPISIYLNDEASKTRQGGESTG